MLEQPGRAAAMVIDKIFILIVLMGFISRVHRLLSAQSRRTLVGADGRLPGQEPCSIKE